MRACSPPPTSGSEDAMAKGTFRRDLFFRLNVIRLELPPLRSRATDIPALCQHFLDKYGVRYQRGKITVPRSLWTRSSASPGPGNVHRLENVIRRYVILPEMELALTDLARSDSPRPENGGPVENSLRGQSAFAAEQLSGRLCCGRSTR